MIWALMQVVVDLLVKDLLRKGNRKPLDFGDTGSVEI